jgi:predicted methyltransferase
MSNRIVALLAGLACMGWAVGQANAQAPSAAIAAALADPGRPDTDTKRDAMRHPAEVVAFAGVGPGQKIAEFVPGGGYYTRILAKTVGQSGHVYSIYPASMGDRAAKGAAGVASTNPNVSLVAQTGSSFILPEKVDAAWITDNYHDLHNTSFGPLDMAVFDKAVFDALKPGGVLLIEDYQAAPGAGASQTSTLHRIEEAQVRLEVTDAGFVFDGESKVLSNPNDDHTLKIFDPAVRGQADQFVLRFRKPN